jgi:8-oxo-dGTP diphosphatase
MSSIINVAAGIIVENNKVLAARRKPGLHLAGFWEFPGGKIEEGETLKQALKRELNEELNINLEIGNFIKKVEYEYPEFYIIMHVFYCHINTRDMDLNEHIDSKWLSKNELFELDWAAADIPIVEKLVSNG